jgi:hypothetical protein
VYFKLVGNKKINIIRMLIEIYLGLLGDGAGGHILNGATGLVGSTTNIL